MSGVPWGGSEELWWRTARRLQTEGHEVCVNFKWWPEPSWQLKQLMENGGEVCFREKRLSRQEIRQEKWAALRRFGRRSNTPDWVAEHRPNVVLVTLGYHPDRINIADSCIREGVPYAINVQSASSFFFIHGDCVDEYRRWYQNAAKVYFVSAENQLKMENNLGMALENAEIIANPFNVPANVSVAWPDDESVFRLACVGRFHFQSKGQDLIVDALRRPHWRERNLEVVFYGHDQGNGRQLKDLIERHGLQSRLKIAGFEKDVSKIWERCHGLLLPSRYEGAALVVIESMLCNRMFIATDTGRNQELVEDGITGFIAAAPTVDLLDATLERAWQNRHRWREMGKLAGQHIRERYTSDPVGDFANCLKSIAR